MAGKVSLGISIYPDFYGIEECKKKVDFAKKYGYSKIFTSIQLGDLGFENTANEITPTFKFLFDYAKEMDIKCHVDINDTMLESIGATPENLEKVHDLNIPVIRLDGGFNKEEIAQFTNNKYGILIEENLSNFLSLEERLHYVKEHGNIAQYCACHNFFPRNDTGLAMQDAINAAMLFKNEGCQTGIFISSQYSKNDLNATGKGVPTVERHRYLPSYIQAEELMATQVFDYIIFGDSDPRCDELIEVYHANKTIGDIVMDEQRQDYKNHLDVPCIDIPAYIENLSEDQIELLESLVLVARDDRADLLIRATQTRGLFDLEPNLCLSRFKNSIFIDNNKSNRYAGELQIMLSDLPDANYTNYIGTIKPYAIDLLKSVYSGNVAFRIRRKLGGRHE